MMRWQLSSTLGSPDSYDRLVLKERLPVVDICEQYRVGKLENRKQRIYHSIETNTHSSDIKYIILSRSVEDTNQFLGDYRYQDRKKISTMGEVVLIVELGLTLIGNSSKNSSELSHCGNTDFLWIKSILSNGVRVNHIWNCIHCILDTTSKYLMWTQMLNENVRLHITGCA